MYTTTVTSQGTITLPAALRRKYNFYAGRIVTISDTGKLEILIPESIQKMREKNNAWLKDKAAVGNLPNGAGFRAYVQKKYDTK
jgi:bifunctional DNA-binding transcriptional regulator/antitoxin component of YhaV-PrlF toxin-antitoxin module